jgi:hypothetical protein
MNLSQVPSRNWPDPVAFERFFFAFRLLREWNDVLAIGDPGSVEAHLHAPPQRLGVEQFIRQLI